MKIRTIIFWIHLCTGIVVGVTVLIMSVTGVLLTYQRQILAWADQHSLAKPTSQVTQTASVGTLLQSVRASQQANPASVTLRSEAGSPVEFSFGREKTLFVDRSSGEVLGQGSAGVRQFFQNLTSWHR